jgi:hypothetical protein
MHCGPQQTAAAGFWILALAYVSRRRLGRSAFGIGGKTSVQGALCYQEAREVTEDDWTPATLMEGQQRQWADPDCIAQDTGSSFCPATSLLCSLGLLTSFFCTSPSKWADNLSFLTQVLLTDFKKWIEKSTTLAPCEGFYNKGPFADMQTEDPLQSSVLQLWGLEERGTKGSFAVSGFPALCNHSLFQKVDVEEPDSANSSFYSTQSAPASQASLRATSSTQSLARLGSPDDGNSALLSLPGYRPTTRSSARRSQAGVSSGAPPGEGTVETYHIPKLDWKWILAQRSWQAFTNPRLASWLPSCNSTTHVSCL